MGPLSDIEDAGKRSRRREEILRQVLDIEIGEKMVAREIEANRDRLGVTEADVDRAVEEVLRINQLGRDQLQAALYGQGLTWAEYRTKLREQIERARLIQYKVQGKVQVKDADVRRRCLERQRAGARQVRVCASHVLLKIPREAGPKEVEQIRARASQLQAELSSGADFAAYALKYSDDNAAPDGALGCFARGEMVEPFERAAFGLQVGDVSPVVRTEFGFHIIKVTDKRTPSTSGCDGEENLESFRNEIYQEEMERQMNNWIAELRRRAFVDVRL
jgi:peptidyl-prolyl cis-trans isomerase SurA